MRPLFFEETDNKKLYTNASTYLWGHDFLVTPIMKDSVDTKEVYFPKGSVWFNFYTGEKIAGGRTKIIKTKENSIPTYVRGGAFIPMGKPMQTTANYDANRLELHYYHDETIAESERMLYNDDGETKNAFEKGMYELLEFESEFENNRLEIELEAEIGENFSATTKEIDVIVHNIDKKPRKIKFRGRRVKFDWNATQKTVRFTVTWNTKKEREITIKL
jgi:alpha-glucosidase (family GH31 glycosyl hydrolase)